MELQELIQSIDIVEYISQYVDLEQRNGEWWGLSCFKEEKTPSFSVRADPPLFYDYSSGFGGNVYSFTKQYFKCSNRETVEKLKKFAGYDGNVDVRHEKLEATLHCKKYQRQKNNTKESKAAKLPDNYMDQYEQNESKLKIWEDEGISKDTLRKFDVRYDRFSNRIVYPIKGMDGKIINVGGRTLDVNWKEKKLRKYTYFHQWGTMSVLYGLYDNLESIRSKREVIIFEGCKSVLLADTWGITNTAAILTSHLNPRQMKELAKLGCRVVFALDKDVIIRNDKNIAKLKNYVDVSYLFDRRGLLDEKDSPVDKGKDVFISLYNEKLRYR